MDADNNNGILKKSLEGGKWLTFDALFQQAISFISFFILARLLFPADFGIVAIILLVIGTSEYFTSPSLEGALVQRQDDINPYLNSLWTLNLIRAIALFIIIFFASPFLVDFFHIEKALWALRLGGFLLVIQRLGNIGQIFFTKEIDFKRIFIRNAIAHTSYIIVAIAWALVFPSFWALVMGQVILYIVTTWTTYLLHPYRPRLDFSFKKLLNLVNYSKWIFGQNAVNKLTTVLDSAVLGRILGPVQVGIYSKALSLASIIPASVNNIISKVEFPAFSKLQNEKEKVKDGFLKSLDIAEIIAIPFLLLFLVGGERLIVILFSNRWIAMTAPLQILSAAVVFSGLIVISYPIFNALGHPKFQFNLDGIKLIILAILLTTLTPKYGTMGAALSLLISSGIMLGFVLGKVKNLLSIKISELIATPAIVISCAGIVGIVMFTLTSRLQRLPDIGFLVVLALMMLAYFGCVLGFGILFKTRPYKTIKILLRDLL